MAARRPTMFINRGRPAHVRRRPRSLFVKGKSPFALPLIPPPELSYEAGVPTDFAAISLFHKRALREKTAAERNAEARAASCMGSSLHCLIGETAIFGRCFRPPLGHA